MHKIRIDWLVGLVQGLECQTECGLHFVSNRHSGKPSEP